MIRVEHQVVAVGYIAVEGHALLMRRHLFHPSHELVLRQEDRQCVRGCGFTADRVAQLVGCRQQCLKRLAQTLFLLVRVVVLGSIFFANQVLNRVAVNAHETQSTLCTLYFVTLSLALGLRHTVHIQLAVHQQHIVAFGFGAFDRRVVRVRIVGVEQHQMSVLVRLRRFHFVDVLVQRAVLTGYVLHQRKAFGTLVELLVGQHTELNEQFDVVPFLGELVLVGFVELCQLVSHFLGDVAAYLLHIVVGLQITTADVQRDVRTIDYAMQQRQVLRHYLLHFVGHKHLVAIELNLVAVYVQVGLYLREIEDTGQVERVIDIQVNMEQRLVHLHRIELVVEMLIVLVLEFRRLAGPGGIDVVDDVVFVQLYLLAVFPLFLLAEGYLHGQELAVLAQQPFYRSVLEVLTELIVDVQHDVRTAFGFDGLFHRVLRRALATPMNGFHHFTILTIFTILGLVTEREDLHFLAHHERRVETETEMSDNTGTLYIVLCHFVLLNKLFRAGESDLIDVLVHFFGGHADAVIRNGQRLFLLIYFYAYAQVVHRHIAGVRLTADHFEFLCRINGIGNQLTQKDLVV